MHTMDETHNMRIQVADYEALNALASLSSLDSSFSLEVDGLTTLRSSGSIPIFLDPGIQLSKSQESFTSADLSSDPSNNTINTIGTFGPRREDGPTEDTQENARLSAYDAFGYTTPTRKNLITRSPGSQHLAPEIHSSTHSLQINRTSIMLYESDRVPLSPSNSTRTLSPHWSPCIDGPERSPREGIVSTGPFHSTSQEYLLDPTGSPSPVHQPPTPIHTVSTAGPTSPSARARSGHREMGHTPDSLTPEHWFHRSPDARGLTGRNAAVPDDIQSSPTPRRYNKLRRNPPSHVGPLEVSHPQLQHTSRKIKIPHLPSTLSWLQTSAVKLWIDQEGFRSVRAALQLAGFSSGSNEGTEEEIADVLTYSRVDFRPAKRQTFIFHHGALDGLPALRQVTLFGDDTKDYISRQASLSLKPNGVYAVSGQETFEPTPPGHLQTSSKLTWRFEYVVDDLRDSKGKTVSGEKTLTPLGFSCSPGLLHPSRGKKTKMMHIFKKTFTFKLAAERMEAPKPPKNFPMPPSPFSRKTHQPATSLSNRNQYITELKYSSTHRRAHSSIDPSAANSTYVDPNNTRPFTRCRPASITALNQLEGSQQPKDRQSFTERRRSLTAPTLKLVRHILPPSELSDLISAPLQTSSADNSILTSVTTGLRPPAHHTRTSPSPF